MRYLYLMLCFVVCFPVSLLSLMLYLMEEYDEEEESLYEYDSKPF